ncbi:hypothetical protein Cmaq_1013 [Caldivirga maquilingensis IC-167]|uniref:Uncharacterized protein n=2 Tax=Caldivirga maquilingensis TaxID=76887 RepID=A8MDI8_CALMQ|nr:hypothetical protein Cmaq_1013 [Caldivirga maquilingensis IC-167]
MTLELKLTLDCPRCGNKLTLREYNKYVQLYCDKCNLSVTIRKRIILMRHVDYDDDVLDWSSALDFLYSLLKGKATASY